MPSKTGNDGGLPLRLRISPWCMPGSGEQDWQRLAEQIGVGGKRWEVAGIKLFVDGTVDNGTAWLFEPDAYGESVAPFWPRPEEYAAAVRFFAGRGIPTATHAIGDAGVAAVLDAFESAASRCAVDCGAVGCACGRAPDRAPRNRPGRPY